jgi:hypothetical protein
MYLHVGHDVVIPYSAIIAWFPYDLLESSPELRHFYLTELVQGFVRGNRHDPKSLILTDDALYLSPISPLTLMRRTRRIRFEFE